MSISGNRYYSPSLGRFINRDPIEEQGGINLYGFCRNNPISTWDYLGNQPVFDTEWDESVARETQPWLFDDYNVERGVEDVFAHIYGMTPSGSDNGFMAWEPANGGNVSSAFRVNLADPTTGYTGDSSSGLFIGTASSYAAAGSASGSAPSGQVQHIDERTVIDEKGQKFIYIDKTTATGSKAEWALAGQDNGTAGIRGGGSVGIGSDGSIPGYRGGETNALYGPGATLGIALPEPRNSLAGISLDGGRFTIYMQNGAERTIPATTGRPGVTDPSLVSQGPIPTGVYTFNSGEISPAGFFRQFTGDWGEFRVPLYPTTGTETYGRGGFFLHGGTIPGSAGCIDIGTNDYWVFPLLKKQTDPVVIVVQPQPGT